MTAFSKLTPPTGPHAVIGAYASTAGFRCYMPLSSRRLYVTGLFDVFVLLPRQSASISRTAYMKSADGLIILTYFRPHVENGEIVSFIAQMRYHRRQLPEFDLLFCFAEMPAARFYRCRHIAISPFLAPDSITCYAVEARIVPCRLRAASLLYSSLRRRLHSGNDCRNGCYIVDRRFAGTPNRKE